MVEKLTSEPIANLEEELEKEGTAFMLDLYKVSKKQ